MIIKVLEKTKLCLPRVFDIGDWVDLITAVDITLKAPHASTLHRYRKEKSEDVDRIRIVDFDYTLIPLGVAIQIPKGYEAIIAPRSSTFFKWGILQTNSIGVIDCSYCSDKDEWKMPVIATRSVTIPKGTRIAQFRIQLSQKATIWQRIKWLFSSSIKIKNVNSLDNPERGGFGEGTENI